MKFGTVVVLDTVSNAIDFGFKMSTLWDRVRVRVVACGIMPECLQSAHSSFQSGSIRAAAKTGGHLIWAHV